MTNEQFLGQLQILCTEIMINVPIVGICVCLIPAVFFYTAVVHFVIKFW